MVRSTRPLIALSAALVAGTVAAQPALTAPNNSAGTPLDTPPAMTRPQAATGMPSPTESSLTAFDKLRGPHEGYVTREDVSHLPGNAQFDEADRNRDGRLDNDEFQRFWNDYQGAGQ